MEELCFGNGAAKPDVSDEGEEGDNSMVRRYSSRSNQSDVFYFLVLFQSL